jgi:hypothetical protein
VSLLAVLTSANLGTFERLSLGFRFPLILGPQLVINAVRRAPSLLDRLRLLAQPSGVGFLFVRNLRRHSHRLFSCCPVVVVARA